MAKFAVPLALSGIGTAGTGEERPGQISAGLELAYLPKVDDATATPTICRPDKPGPENTDLLFALPRPRIQAALPGAFLLEASWVPPIRVAGTRAHLFGFALARTLPLRSEALRLTLRAHGTLGTVEGPITCDDQALQDPNSPCYQGTRSNDTFRPNIFGLEATVSWSLAGRVYPYLGAGYSHLAPRFRVNFTNQFGNVDRTRVEVDLDRVVLYAGAAWTGGRIRLGAEVYSAPADAVTARVMVGYRIR